VNTAPEMPSDLDRAAKKKWEEMLGSCDVDVDLEMLANYCRQHSSLMAIRGEKSRQVKARTFETMVRGRDGTMVLNPLLVTENRLIASLNRMLKSLGLTIPQEQRGPKRPLPEVGQIDPLELALCGPGPERNPAQIEADRRRAANEKLLAANDWRAYEQNFDGGKENGPNIKP
jgi:hypothetical protein